MQAQNLKIKQVFEMVPGELRTLFPSDQDQIHKNVYVP